MPFSFVVQNWTRGHFDKVHFNEEKCGLYIIKLQGYVNIVSLLNHAVLHLSPCTFVPNFKGNFIYN